MNKDRPAFHVDDKLKKAAKKVAEAFEPKKFKDYYGESMGHPSKMFDVATENMLNDHAKKLQELEDKIEFIIQRKDSNYFCDCGYVLERKSKDRWQDSCQNCNKTLKEIYQEKQ